MTETPGRSRANKETGEAFAALLAEKHSHQLGCCAKLGIPWSTHMRWMASTAAEGSDLEAYQKAVLVALDEQRKRDLDEIDVQLETAEPNRIATMWNVRKHRHESRFKRFYEADAQKVELTGAGGGPVQMTALTREQALAELRELAKTDPAVAGLLRESGE